MSGTTPQSSVQTRGTLQITILFTNDRSVISMDIEPLNTVLLVSALAPVCMAKSRKKISKKSIVESKAFTIIKLDMFVKMTHYYKPGIIAHT